MKLLFKPIILSLLFSIGFISCSDDDEDDKPAPASNQTSTVSASQFSTQVDENPRNGQSLGFLQATSANTNDSINYGWFTPELGLNVNVSTGELFVEDSSYFDYEQTTAIKAVAVAFLEGNSNIFDTATVIIRINNIVEPAEMSVQKRLDNSETPFQIYQSDNSLLDSLYGKTFDGGLIFYLNINDGSGLVAAEMDQSTGIAWDTTSNLSTIITTGATSKAVGDGASNTATIVSALSSLGGYAAELCNDLSLNSKSDWFLPSADEADLMFNNLQSKGVGGFAAEFYWTSSEFDFSGAAAWYRNFDTSASQISGTTPKNASYHVRAVRAF